jgi:SAM-dependent methyltransferase
MWFAFDETFPYFECRTCGTVYIAEVPTNLARYYEPDRYYSLQSDAEAVLGRPGVAQVVGALGRSILGGRDVLGRLMSRVPVRKVSMMVTGFRAVAVSGLPRGMASRVLDVGAGSGLLVYALHLAGMREVEGVDPFLGADVRYANGATVRKAGFEDVTDTYDVVMLNHSFEHVADPGRTLEQLKSRLAPGGRAVIRMPTVSSEAYETYGIDYYGLDAPRHLTIFSRSGMDGLCREHGFRVVRVADDSDSAQFWASEQIRRRIPLASPESHYLDPRGSVFSARQAMGWERRARELNRQGRGDQAAWVIEPA